MASFPTISSLARRRWWGLLLGMCLLGASRAGAASIALQRHDGEREFTAEIGQQLDLEVVIYAAAEELTGYTFFLSFDPQVFRLVPAGQSVAGQPEPFAPGEFLKGLVLLNQLEESDGQAWCSFATAVGVQRPPRTGAGVAARLKLEVVRRPQGGAAARLRLEQGGHDHVSHYTTSARPGVELRFAPPLGEVEVRVTGFRIEPLPDVELVEGEEKMVFDLDDFVDQGEVQVIWTASRLNEIPTLIDPETRQVRMQPQRGLSGERRMIFTAFETTEGLTVADTIRIGVFSRPRISGFPDTLKFPEDSTHQQLDLDAFVEDLDDRPDSLNWEASAGPQVQVEINPFTHIPILSAAPDWFGEELIRLMVQDREGLADTAAVVVQVTPVNDPPQVRGADPVYPVQGGGPLQIPLAALVEDKDDALNTLQFELETEGGISAEIRGDTLLVQGDREGRGVVRLAVQDTSGEAASGRQVAVVLAPGQGVAPKIQSLPALRFPAGQEGRLPLDSLARDDSSASALQWSAVPDANLRARVEGNELRVSAASGFSGKGEVILQARDPEGNQDQAELEVEVLAEGEPLGPRIAAPGKIGLVVGQQQGIDLDPLVEDLDDPDERITWTSLALPGLEDSLDAVHRRLYLKAAEKGEPAAVVLKATDPAGNADQAVVPVLVVAPGDPPRLRDFAPVSLDTVAAQARIDLDEFAFDGEDREAELSWTAQAPPGVEAEVDPVNHLLRVRRTEAGGDTSSTAQVALQVRDTSGRTASALLIVQLPPVFSLKPMPEIAFFANQVDTSLALDQYVEAPGRLPPLSWSAAPARDLEVQIDPATHRVRLQANRPEFQGSETLSFTATDPTGRARTGQVRVQVKAPGLAPQLRAFPPIQLRRGEANTAIDLDDFVVDDDPDTLLRWSASAPPALRATIDPSTHVVSLSTESVSPGLEQVHFLVADPAGNVATGTLEVTIVQAGEAPGLAPLPQIRLPAGGPEQRLGLDVFVSDPDTPDEQLSWEVSAEAGVEARIEGRQLVMSVPAGPSGSRQVRLSVTDPEGNRAQGVLQIEIDIDAQAPQLLLQVGRHPLFSELLELKVQASEGLREAPQVEVGDEPVEMKKQDDSVYVGYYQVPDITGEQFFDIAARGFDRAGNEGRLLQPVALRWMDKEGGSLGSPDVQVGLNVADAAAGPGRLAVLFRVDPGQVPPGSEGRPVYAADLARGRDLVHPVTLNFYAGAGAAGDLGVLRWDAEGKEWEELPTSVDSTSGWLSVSVDRLGLFRLGPVSPASRQKSAELTNYPNPFSAALPTQIVYEVAVPGPVRLEVFNLLGQPVRLLVDEEFQDVGVWSAGWDGRDQDGQPLASGLYFCRLRQAGGHHQRPLLLIH